MDFFDNKYYKYNRFFMSLLGLWPYQEPSTKLIRSSIVQLILSTNIFCSAAKIVTCTKNLEIIIEILIYFFTFVCITSIYMASYIHMDKVKFLFDQIKNDWMEFRNTEQFFIVKHYAEESRIYTLLFMVVFLYFFPVSFSACIVAILAAPMISIIMDVIVPLNETRPHKLPIQIELFIDENEYYYTSCIIITLLSCGIIITMIGSYSMFTTYVQHACGMFSLAGNALEQILNELELTENKCKSVTNIHENIVRGIKYHNKAMQLRIRNF
uniref:uncharacterized protein LOC127068416 n=1 Tax=Vespula vulgaris TaxID=7454 RepID=UPI00223B9F97|nr:uncharacterized protein LOC127068416 [Vespula vulgaris]